MHTVNVCVYVSVLSTSSFNFLHFPPFSNAGMLWLIATLFSRFVLLFPVPLPHMRSVPLRPFSSSSYFSFYLIRPVAHTALDFNVSIKSDASARCYHCRSCRRRSHRRCCFHCRLIVIIVTCILAIYSRKFHVCMCACVSLIFLHFYNFNKRNNKR